MGRIDRQLLWTGLALICCTAMFAQISNKLDASNVNSWGEVTLRKELFPVLPLVDQLFANRKTQEISASGTTMLLVMSAVYLWAAARVIKSPLAKIPTRSGRVQLWWIILVACICRWLMWLSAPFQEVDIYRYMWDGMVARAGINPFERAPRTELPTPWSVMGPFGSTDPTWKPLWGTRGTLPNFESIQDCQYRVHYGELKTIYPAVSQLAFHLVASWRWPSVTQYMLGMKLFFVAVELMLLMAAQLLLVRLGRPREWIILLAWSPLLLKEIANSGHLDCIPALFSLLAVLSLLPRMGCLRMALAGGLLGLAIAAKWYAVVLFPCMSIWILVRSMGWRARLINVMTFWLASLCIIACVTYPYCYRWSGVDARGLREWVSPTGSLGTFGGHWRMNDFFYSYVRESLREPVPMFTARVGNSIQSRPMTMRDGQPLMDVSSLSPDSSSNLVVILGSELNPTSPWYVILPLTWRQELNARMTKMIDELKLRSYAESAESDLDFVLRIAFAFLYLLISLVLCYGLWRNPSPLRFVQTCYLSLTFFWLLLPTGNPWYLVWGMPFLLAMDRTVWRVLPVVVLISYYRFACDVPTLLGYSPGTRFFDEVLLMVEFVPWLLWLWIDWLWRSFKSLKVPD